MIPANVPVKKKKTVRLRSKALREVRKEQSRTNHVIPAAPFNRLVRNIVADATTEDIRFRSSAIEALQTDTEDYLIGMFHDANLIAIQSGRETLHVNDIELWKSIKGK